MNVKIFLARYSLILAMSPAMAIASGRDYLCDKINSAKEHNGPGIVAFGGRLTLPINYNFISEGSPISRFSRIIMDFDDLGYGEVKVGLVSDIGKAGIPFDINNSPSIENVDFHKFGDVAVHVFHNDPAVSGLTAAVIVGRKDFIYIVDQVEDLWRKIIISYEPIMNDPEIRNPCLVGK